MQALHLLTLREKLNDMQSEAEQKNAASEETEEEKLQEMHQVLGISYMFH